MSSRVQKGGTLFRPVVKSRPKTANTFSRQPSTSVEQDVHVPEASQSLQTETQTESQFEPVPRQSLPVEAADSLGRSSVVPEEFTPRPPVLPHPVGVSIIGISQRPVRSVPIVVPARTATVPRSSVQGLAVAGPSISTTVLVDSLPIATAPIELTETSTTESRSDLGSSMNNTTITEPVEEFTPIPPTDTSNPLEENPQRTSKRRKSQDEESKRQKRRKSVQKEGDVATEDQNTAPKRSRSRASSGTPRPRKKALSPPPYDPDADPGEDIDPTTVTMASLCSDTGQGRVSRKAAEILSNHAAWKTKNRERRARMKMIMEAKKYGREEEEAELEAESTAAQEQEKESPSEQSSSTPQRSAAITDDTGNGFDYTEDLTTSRFNVQVRIGPNGETVIDENSLVVDRVEDDGTDNYTHVVESDHTKFVNSGTYGKRYRGSRWSAEETELFYDALSQYGENYELISYVLPGRDRKSCKNKFKAEDKKNHARINHCLDNSIPVDMKTLSRMTGKDFSGPVPEIRAPTPLPLIPPNEESTENNDEPSEPSVKRRSRSKSQGVDNGLIVVGDAENFES